MGEIDRDIDRVLLTQEQLHERIRALGTELTRDYAGKNPIFICTLKGAVHFFSELLLTLPFACRYDFAVCSSYGSNTRSSGKVELVTDISLSLEGQHVVLIDDIIDTGLTLRFLTDTFRERRPASLKVCALMDKPERRITKISADYVGFTIPNVFVVGYGLDYGQLYRNLPYIGVLKPDVYGG